MPTVCLHAPSARYLCFAEREDIALLRAEGKGVREIAREIGRSPSTISRELRRNAATRSGRMDYRASVAQWHAEQRAKRPKPAKLAVNDRLREYVAAHTPQASAAALTASERDGSVVVEVSDDGPGVPPDQLARIFDRFYRAGVPSRRPGSGLGLAIAAAVAAAHDGNVSAALNEPHGLRVTLTLPGSRQHPAQPASISPVHQVRPTA